MPYERIVARVIGEYYDSPLDPAKQHPEVMSLGELKGEGDAGDRPHSSITGFTKS